jgi:hypothetical protein
MVSHIKILFRVPDANHVLGRSLPVEAAALSPSTDQGIGVSLKRVGRFGAGGVRGRRAVSAVAVFPELAFVSADCGGVSSLASCDAECCRSYFN